MGIPTTLSKKMRQPSIAEQRQLRIFWLTRRGVREDKCLGGQPSMARTVLLARVIGEPDDYLTRLDVRRIRYAVRWPAVTGRRLIAPWTRMIGPLVDDVHVLVCMDDGRIAVTRHDSVAGFLEDL